MVRFTLLFGCSALLFTCAHSQTHVPQTLVGCAAVDCPNIAQNGIEISCNVNNTNNRLIGLTSLRNPIASSSADFTWTLGVAVYPGADAPSDDSFPSRIVERSFYLGTPPSLNLRDFTSTGCAFFFRRQDNEPYPTFNAPGSPRYAASSDCRSAIGSQNGGNCIGDLQSQALGLGNALPADQSSQEACSSIADSLQQNSPSSCVFSSNPMIEAIPITGDSAPTPIQESNNGSANCWPTLPKSNDLATVYAFNQTSLLNETNSYLGNTPLMTVFFNRNSNSSADESYFTCMKIVDTDNASLQTLNNGTGDGKTGAASSLPYGVSGLVVPVVFLVAGVFGLGVL